MHITSYYKNISDALGLLTLYWQSFNNFIDCARYGLRVLVRRGFLLVAFAKRPVPSDGMSVQIFFSLKPSLPKVHWFRFSWLQTQAQ
jgi:hypothetical protein